MSDKRNKALPPAGESLPKTSGNGNPESAPARKADVAEGVVYRDALASARQLKRQYRAYYDTDPKAFRAMVRKAHSESSE